MKRGQAILEFIDQIEEGDEKMKAEAEDEGRGWKTVDCYDLFVWINVLTSSREDFKLERSSWEDFKRDHSDNGAKFSIENLLTVFGVLLLFLFLYMYQT